MKLLGRSRALPFVYDDGGRVAEARARLGDEVHILALPTGDCVARAIAIALAEPYEATCEALDDTVRAQYGALWARGPSAARGLPRTIYEPFLRERGWVWTPTMHIGSGCRVHLAKQELPPGRLIARLSKHLAAVIDGTVHDIADPTRDGTRCVYGYFRKENR
jgi:hypothetical protein